MSEEKDILERLESLVPQWLTLPDIAEILDIPVTRVRNLFDDNALVDVRRGSPAVRSVPRDFLLEGELIPHLQGTITLLRDQGFESAEIIEWLMSEDDTLPGRPIDHLRAGQRGEVRRRAQSLGF